MFLALPEEKQQTVLDAAFRSFAKMGYKKASAADIAAAAGISKGMIFHYFGNKKAMYLYLLNFSYRHMILSFQNLAHKPVSDFFDRILLGVEIKLQLLEQYPAMLQFITSAYFETDPQVANEVRAILNDSGKFRNTFALSDLDLTKFKDDVNPALVLNILLKFSQGYVSESGPGFDLDKVIREFTACLELMRNHFYKEEYL